MKIAVNTRLLIKDKLEGIGWFAFETLKRITQQHPEHQFYFLFDRNYDRDFVFAPNVTPINLRFQARHPILYYIYFEYIVPKALSKIKPDIFLSPDGYLSLKTTAKSVQVIHDLNFEHYPQYLPFAERKYYSYFFKKYAQMADRIATVSEYSKNDIHSQYGIELNKIDVVYNGASEVYQPITDEEAILIRERYTQGNPYFLFVGSLHPRKNVSRLFKAFDVFRQSNDSGVKLLIVGREKWSTEIMETHNSMQFKDEVIFSGHLSQFELKDVYAAAFSLVYVPIFEGFGIPIIEAMNCNLPVITSDVTSMPEVAGDSALLVDPFSINSISEGMKNIYYDENLRKQLIAKGMIRRNAFSWQKTADRLWETICKIVQP